MVEAVRGPRAEAAGTRRARRPARSRTARASPRGARGPPGRTRRTATRGREREHVAHVAAHGPSALDAQERSVDAHGGARLPHAAHVVGRETLHERHPRVELPAHLHVEVGRLAQTRQHPRQRGVQARSTTYNIVLTYSYSYFRTHCIRFDVFTREDRTAQSSSDAVIRASAAPTRHIYRRERYGWPLSVRAAATMSVTRRA